MLDESLELAEGTHVRLILDAGESEQIDRCVDGSLCDESPEGLRRWTEWCDSFEPVFGDAEATEFELRLRESQMQQASLLPGWHCGEQAGRCRCLTCRSQPSH